MKISFLLLSFLFLIVARSAYGDGVAVFELPGNTVFPVEQNDIRMVKEVVTVDDDEVKAVFTFENTTSKSISVKMGFPFKDESDLNYEPHGKFFRVFIGGNEVPSSKKKATQNIKLIIGDNYSSYYTWDLNFAPFERKTVDCIYSADWACDPQPHPACTHFTYITKTGSLWKDKIHEADFYITLPRGYGDDINSKRLVIEITPPAHKKTGDLLEWHFKEWKPTQDISIDISRSPSYPLQDFELVALMVNILDFIQYEGGKRLYTVEDLKMHDYDKQLARLYVRVLRNEIYARHGKVLKSSILNSIFGGQNWYKPNPKYSDNMLNDIERKNIRFIREYEKQKGWQ